MRACRLERELVDDTLRLVERAVDAVDLVGRDDIGRHALLELGEPLVIAVLEGLEGAHEAVEGGGKIGRRVGFGFDSGVSGHGGSFAWVRW